MRCFHPTPKTQTPQTQNSAKVRCPLRISYGCSLAAGAWKNLKKAPPRKSLVRSVHDSSISVPSNREGYAALGFYRGSGASATKGARDHEDGHSRDGHSFLIPAMVGKGRCADRQAGTFGPRQTYQFSCSVARGPQPARGGRRRQDPIDATLARLADALEAIGVNGCGSVLSRCCLGPPPHIPSTPGSNLDCKRRHRWRRRAHPRNKKSRGPVGQQKPPLAHVRADQLPQGGAP
jgi:hypothetical protein